MAIQFSSDVRNGELNAIETAVGTSPILRIYDLAGTAPQFCSHSMPTNTLLAEITLPSDWEGAASGGSVVLSGTWQDTSANAAGTADFFRIYNSGDTICHIQGTVSITSGGGDLELDNNVIAVGQQVTVTKFTLTAANA